jgi:phytoene synthase
MTIHQVQPTWESVLLDWAYQPLEAHVPVEKTGAVGHTLDAAYRACEAITRAHSRTFTIASGLLPPDQRRAARALYAFCRVTDNIIDHAGGEDADITRARLNAWRALTLHGHPSINQTDEMRLAALAWSDARARYNIPTGYAEQLIDGVARDLEKKRYATFDELAEYAYAVASTVGLMAMHIIGFEGEDAIPYAVKLGVALQVTNILRDVREDWHAGRLYLPQDELTYFGLSEADIEAAIPDDRWRAFMDYQIARTRRLYDEAYSGIALLNPRGRFAIAAAADLYRAILSDIERSQYDVFTRRAHVSAITKASLLPAIWWRSRTVRITD